MLFISVHYCYGANITVTLDSNDGSSFFSFHDSGAVKMAHIDSDGNLMVRGGVRIDAGGVECATSEMLIVDGFIGISTDNPTCKLDVNNGNVQITSSPGNGSDAALLLRSSEGSMDSWMLSIDESASEKLFLSHTLASNMMTFTTGGTVGVGVTSPGLTDSGSATGKSSGNILLDVKGSVRTHGYDDDEGMGRIYFFSDTSNKDVAYIGASTNNSWDLTFGTANVGGTEIIERMRIDYNTGNVGIGTVSPSESLEVQGSMELNGPLKGGVRVYSSDLGVSTYNAGNANTKTSISLGEGTWYITTSFEWKYTYDPGSSPYWGQWRLRNTTDGTTIYGGTDDDTSFWEHKPSFNYFHSYSASTIYTVAAGVSKTIALQFRGATWTCQVRRAVIYAVRLE